MLQGRHGIISTRASTGRKFWSRAVCVFCPFRGRNINANTVVGFALLRRGVSLDSRFKECAVRLRDDAAPKGGLFDATCNSDDGLDTGLALTLWLLGCGDQLAPPGRGAGARQ